MKERTSDLIYGAILTPLAILTFALMIIIVIAVLLITAPFALYAELRDWEGHKRRKKLW